jgi:hypothetical protein
MVNKGNGDNDGNENNQDNKQPGKDNTNGIDYNSDNIYSGTDLQDLVVKFNDRLQEIISNQIDNIGTDNSSFNADLQKLIDSLNSDILSNIAK